MNKESIITDWMEFCVICGAKTENIHHAIPGTANRAKADKYGLVMPLCVRCHDDIHRNPKMTTMRKIIGQLAYEKEAAIDYCVTDNKELLKQTIRDDFMEVFGKSHI